MIFCYQTSERKLENIGFFQLFFRYTQLVNAMKEEEWEKKGPANKRNYEVRKKKFEGDISHFFSFF